MVWLQGSQLSTVPRGEVRAQYLRQRHVPAVARGMVPVHCIQGFIKIQLVKVCMGLGTKPFAKALHRCLVLLMHLLPAQRATLVEETCEEMRQHAFVLPREAPVAAYHSGIILVLEMARRHPVTILQNAKRVPVSIHEAGSAS
jgi:hypothetical protein